MDLKPNPTFQTKVPLFEAVNQYNTHTFIFIPWF